MELPVGCHQMVKHLGLLLSALLVLVDAFPPVPVCIHQPRPAERLPGEALHEPLRAMDITRRWCPYLGRKHEEA